MGLLGFQPACLGLLVFREYLGAMGFEALLRGFRNKGSWNPKPCKLYKPYMHQSLNPIPKRLVVLEVGVGC